MVLFDEDPVTLISETTTQFHIAPDKDSLTRISGSLSALQNTRAVRLDQHTTILKNLSRRLNTLQSQVGFEEERHDAGKHAAEMLRMDTEKFRVAKGVSEVEWEGERLGSEAASLRGVLEGLEREGVEGGRRAGAEAEDEIVLKLQFYRSLGIDVSQDATTGDFHRAVIRNTARGDVNVVNVDSKLPQSFYANMFWDGL
ncbi:putative kinetochore protein spc24 [Recurvomyces mirabilis]|nr:putative kinetochore protein spc24 [Recurvomyces mirabilis]